MCGGGGGGEGVVSSTYFHTKISFVALTYLVHAGILSYIGAILSDYIDLAICVVWHVVVNLFPLDTVCRNSVAWL